MSGETLCNDYLQKLSPNEQPSLISQLAVKVELLPQVEDARKTLEPVTQLDDTRYYAIVNDLPFAGRVSATARRRVLDLFFREMKPTSTSRVVDIGVSSFDTPESNMIEKVYPWPQNLTCCGLDDPELFKAHQPSLTYHQVASGRRLPFPDQSFDIVYSNAVIEHVGGPQRRRKFLEEALRVGRSLFIAYPNRWFPLEVHTGLPFLHYSPALFRRLLANGPKDFFAHIENVDFIGKSAVRRDLPASVQAPRFRYTGLPLGPFSSNVAVIVTR